MQQKIMPLSNEGNDFQCSKWWTPKLIAYQIVDASKMMKISPHLFNLIVHTYIYIHTYIHTYICNNTPPHKTITIEGHIITYNRRWAPTSLQGHYLTYSTKKPHGISLELEIALEDVPRDYITIFNEVDIGIFLIFKNYLFIYLDCILVP
jgi:hypothetical protein